MLSCMSSMYIFDISSLSNMLLCDLVTKLCLTLVTPWVAACQAPLYMGFPRQGYWSGLPFPSPGYLPNPGIEPTSPALQQSSTMQVDSLPTKPPGKLLANVSFANIFSHSVGYLHFLIVSFSVQKFFSWIWSRLFIFAFVSLVQEIDLKKYS